MPQAARKPSKATKTKPRAKTKPSPKAKPSARDKRPAGRRGGLATTARLSKDVLAAVEEGQRSAIAAVEAFVDSVDKVLPALPRDEGPSRRQVILDSALEMADRLVHAQYEFIRKVVDDAGTSLGGRTTRRR